MPKNTKNVFGIADKIIPLSARGLTTREINEQIQNLYGIEVSASLVSNITDQIIPEIKEWQERDLGSVDPIIFIDNESSKFGLRPVCTKFFGIKFSLDHKKYNTNRTMDLKI